jgi:gluconolactonase
MTATGAAIAVACTLAAACSSNGSAPSGKPAPVGSTDGGPSRDSGHAPPVYGDPLAGVAPVSVVQTGFGRIEGPVWLGGALFFSDIPNNRIERLTPPAAVAVFRDPSGNSNGLAIDAEGKLIACEESTHRVTRALADGGVAVIADQWQGHPFNAPNDLTVRKDGTIYFTDPGFDYPAPDGPPNRSVYAVDPSGRLSLASDGFDRPNGITLSISEKTLYVSDTLAAVVRSLVVNADGTLGPPVPFASTAPIADGMCIDDAGNLYVTTASAVQVFLPDGTLKGEIPVGPEAPANCAFGGADRRTLYITAGKTLYSVQTPIPGRPY